jgi:hypothetical protein
MPPSKSPKPLPARFMLKAESFIVAAGQLFPIMNATYYVDTDQHATVVLPELSTPAHCQGFVIAEYFFASMSYYVEQGVCRDVPGYNSSMMAANLFASLATAKLNSTGALPWYGSKLLPKYTFSSTESNGTYWVDETGPTSRVVALDYTFTAAGLPGSKPATSHQLVNFVAWGPLPKDTPKDVFAVPAECSRPSPLCNASRTAAESAVNKTFYLAHPLNQTGQLANQDAGDLLGDANFLCLYTSPGGSAMDDYDSLSKYTIEVDSRWGAYSLCNGYPGQCMGVEKVAVGRQASTPCATLGGQCTDNSAFFGNWFSLPKVGASLPTLF